MCLSPLTAYQGGLQWQTTARYDISKGKKSGQNKDKIKQLIFCGWERTEENLCWGDNPKLCWAQTSPLGKSPAGLPHVVASLSLGPYIVLQLKEDFFFKFIFKIQFFE